MRMASAAMLALPDSLHLARQNGGECAALAEHAAHFDAPALGFDDALGERQAQTGSGVPLGRASIELLKLDEQPAHVLRLDADPGILHVYAELVVAQGGDAHLDLTAVGRELDGVGQEVIEDLLQ